MNISCGYQRYLAHLLKVFMMSVMFIPYVFKIVTYLLSDIPILCRVNGGVCNNDFLMQMIADFTNQTIDRAKQRANMTSLGVAFLAGLAKGVF